MCKIILAKLCEGITSGAIAGGVSSGIAAASGAAGAAIMQAADADGNHSIGDVTKAAALGNAIIFGALGFTLAATNSHKFFAERSKTTTGRSCYSIFPFVASTLLVLLGSALGYAILKSDLNINLRTTVIDTAVGVGVINLSLLLCAFCCVCCIAALRSKVKDSTEVRESEPIAINEDHVAINEDHGFFPVTP